MRKSLKKIVSAITAGAMALALGVTVIPSVAFAANDPTKEAIALGKKDFDPNGEYNAYFMFQAGKDYLVKLGTSEIRSSRRKPVSTMQTGTRCLLH